jgi:hypothetical protein
MLSVVSLPSHPGIPRLAENEMINLRDVPLAHEEFAKNFTKMSFSNGK